MPSCRVCGLQQKREAELSFGEDTKKRKLWVDRFCPPINHLSGAVGAVDDVDAIALLSSHPTILHSCYGDPDVPSAQLISERSKSNLQNLLTLCSKH